MVLLYWSKEKIKAAEETIRESLKDKVAEVPLDDSQSDQTTETIEGKNKEISLEETKGNNKKDYREEVKSSFALV